MISSSIYTNEDLGKYPEGIQKALEYLMKMYSLLQREEKCWDMLRI